MSNITEGDVRIGLGILAGIHGEPLPGLGPFVDQIRDGRVLDPYRVAPGLAIMARLLFQFDEDNSIRLVNSPNTEDLEAPSTETLRASLQENSRARFVGEHVSGSLDSRHTIHIAPVFPVDDSLQLNLFLRNIFAESRVDVSSLTPLWGRGPNEDYRYPGMRLPEAFHIDRSAKGEGGNNRGAQTIVRVYPDEALAQLAVFFQQQVAAGVTFIESSELFDMRSLELGGVTDRLYALWQQGDVVARYFTMEGVPLFVRQTVFEDLGVVNDSRKQFGMGMNPAEREVINQLNSGAQLSMADIVAIFGAYHYAVTTARSFASTRLATDHFGQQAGIAIMKSRSPEDSRKVIFQMKQE